MEFRSLFKKKKKASPKKEMAFQSNVRFSLWGLLILLLVSVASVGIGYSAMNTTLNMSGDAHFRVEADIRITALRILEKENGGDVLYNPDFSRDTIITGINLPNLDSTVTFEIQVTNFTNIPMALNEIINLNMSNPNITYTITGIELNDLVDEYETKTFTITFHYLYDLYYLPDDTTLQSRIEFKFIVGRDVVTVTFMINGAETIGATSLTCNIYYPATSCEIIAPTITRYGYRIVGWHTNPNASFSTWNVSQARQVSANETWHAITLIPGLRELVLANNEVRTGADFTVTATNANRDTQEGLFTTQDNMGTSYYFRGTHALNNNVIFAGHQWKIIRIDGNGNIRMIYNGVCPNNSCVINGNTAGVAASIAPGSPFNNPTIDNRSVGYMFGDSCDTYDECHANINYSNIKQRIDTFVNSLPANAQALLVETIFCNDRSLFGGTGIGVDNTQFMGLNRITNLFQPSLYCTQPNDRLMLRAGLITADEASMAGGRRVHQNTDFFLRTGQLQWTMTPNNTIMNVLWMNNINPTGIINISPGDTNAGVRPVISLHPSVQILSGDGSTLSPYIIEIP